MSDLRPRTSSLQLSIKQSCDFFVTSICFERVKRDNPAHRLVILPYFIEYAVNKAIASFVRLTYSIAHRSTST
jgi:hypothetical protein